MEIASCCEWYVVDHVKRCRSREISLIVASTSVFKNIVIPSMMNELRGHRRSHGREFLTRELSPPPTIKTLAPTGVNALQINTLLASPRRSKSQPSPASEIGEIRDSGTSDKSEPKRCSRKMRDSIRRNVVTNGVLIIKTNESSDTR